jgi:hypothetical protein
MNSTHKKKLVLTQNGVKTNLDTIKTELFETFGGCEAL